MAAPNPARLNDQLPAWLIPHVVGTLGIKFVPWDHLTEDEQITIKAIGAMYDAGTGSRTGHPTEAEWTRNVHEEVQKQTTHLLWVGGTDGRWVAATAADILCELNERHVVSALRIRTRPAEPPPFV